MATSCPYCLKLDVCECDEPPRFNPRSTECPGCTICEVSKGGPDGEHHWLEDFDEMTGEPVWDCKHCSARRAYDDPDDENISELTP